MKTYFIDVIVEGRGRCEYKVEASFYTIENGAIIFYTGKYTTVAVYPVARTIITKIEVND